MKLVHSTEFLESVRCLRECDAILFAHGELGWPQILTLKLHALKCRPCKRYVEEQMRLARAMKTAFGTAGAVGPYQLVNGSKGYRRQMIAAAAIAAVSVLFAANLFFGWIGASQPEAHPAATKLPPPTRCEDDKEDTATRKPGNPTKTIRPPAVQK